VHDNGPKLGTVNLTKLHPSILNLLEDCEFIDARGARNYEMMQGINKNVFFGFMVCREFSEATTGLNAEDTPLIYIKHSSGERSFSGFRKRTKKKSYFCETTARERRRKWAGGHLALFSTWSDDEKARYKVNQAFYSKGALDFHKKYGDLLEKEVKAFLGGISGRVLVLGCGSGKEVGYLYQGGRDAIGIDFSVEAVHLARNRYPHLWNRFFVEDIYNTRDFAEGLFDGVVANASFVHLLKRGDLGTLLEQVYSRLRLGGIFFLRLIDKEGIREEYDTHLFNSRRWFVYYEENEILTLAGEIGFNILSNTRTGHMQYRSVSWLSFLLQKAEYSNAEFPKNGVMSCLLPYINE
jgi:SAM-dependent methyltransferase